MAAPLHSLEPQRLAALEALRILDTSVSASWDRLAKLASVVCNTPIALISLVDADRQWFKATVGLDVRETPREQSFCAHAILDDEVFHIPSAIDDERFVDNELVTGPPGIRAYVGAVIRDIDGLPLGTVCAIDDKPRDFDERQTEALQLLAEEASGLLAWRRVALDTHHVLAEAKKMTVWASAREHADFTRGLMQVFLRLTRLRDHVEPQGRDDFVHVRQELEALRDRMLHRDPIGP